MKSACSADTILGALADVLPDRAMAACSGTMNNFTIGGYDKESGEYFSYVETYGGGQGGMAGSTAWTACTQT